LDEAARVSPFTVGVAAIETGAGLAGETVQMLGRLTAAAPVHTIADLLGQLALVAPLHGMAEV
jgi:hypothetical protein